MLQGMVFIMKKISVLFILFNFFTSALYASEKPQIISVNLVKCNGCSDQTISSHAASMYSLSGVGVYEVNYLDITGGILSVTTVNVTPVNVGKDRSETEVHAHVDSSDSEISGKLKSVRESYEKINDIFRRGYTLDSRFAFKDVYQALLAKEAFKQEVEFYIRNAANILRNLDNAKAAAAIIAGKTSAQSRAVLASVASHSINNTKVTFTLSDGTKIEVKIAFQFVDGELTFEVVDLGLAYTADGQLVPTSSFQMQNHDASGVYSSSYIQYLGTLNIDVTVNGSFAGRSTCPTKLTCNENGTECVAATVSCE